MKPKLNTKKKVSTKLKQGSVKSSKDYVVITPEGKQISVEEYMETKDYNNKLEQQISDFMTNKREKELIKLFSN